MAGESNSWAVEGFIKGSMFVSEPYLPPGARWRGGRQSTSRGCGTPSAPTPPSPPRRRPVVLLTQRENQSQERRQYIPSVGTDRRRGGRICAAPSHQVSLGFRMRKASQPPTGLIITRAYYPKMSYRRG
eukprot:186094-Prorocentrum_minimum.AAC.1